MVHHKDAQDGGGGGGGGQVAQYLLLRTLYCLAMFCL